MRLGTRVFQVVFLLYLAVSVLGSAAVYFISSSLNWSQAKSSLEAVVQYNAESMDKSLLRAFELLIYPSYLPSLYDLVLGSDPARLSAAQKIILRRDIESLFALNTYVPLRTYFPNSEYRFAVDSAAPVASLFPEDEPGPIVAMEAVRATGARWLPEDNEILVTPGPAGGVVLSRRVQLLRDGARHFAGVLALQVPVADLTRAQDAHPLGTANLFFLKTPRGDLIRLSPGSEAIPAALFDNIEYHNNRSPGVEVLARGVTYLRQPFRLNSGWELTALVPVATIQGSLSPVLVVLLAVDLLMLIALFALSRTWIPRLISDPVTRLADAITGVVAHDDYSRALPVDASSTEVRSLYEAYNQLLAHITRLIARIYDENERSRQAEILALQAQINPHFLYNTLDSIGWSLPKSSSEVRGVLSSLSLLLRYGLQEPTRMVLLSEEVSAVRDYLAIQEFCYSLRVALEVPDRLLHAVRLPKLTLQPLVENAVLHGIREAEGIEPRISITAELNDDVLEVAVRNNGHSPQLQDLELHLGGGPVTAHGLGNVDRRLRIRFGEEGRLRLSLPPDGGLEVRFRIPVSVALGSGDPT